VTVQATPPSSLRPDLKSEWLLDPRITFLNHGSFGALPRCVFEEQTRWRLRIEAEPIEVLARRGYELIANVKREVGAFVGMHPADFGLVTNATDGINAVLRSLSFHPGDELLTTSHVYHAVRQTMKYVAGRAGAAYREIDLSIPIHSPTEVIDCVIRGLGHRTRLLVIDHVTSPTALVLPIKSIVEQCQARGIDVMVDGAHAPGMLPLDVPYIGATYYAGNLHKWTCAPKGSGFLWVRPDHQTEIHPLGISHHLNEGFAREFDWQGTRDISGWLAIPRAMQFMSELGWEKTREHNHAMTVWVQEMLCEAWQAEPISPIDGALLGSMATIQMPAPLDQLRLDQMQALQRKLYDDHQIEVPLMRWSDRVLIRPCCQVYNTPDEYERLAKVIATLADL
jgi:isopenicillin-N epimerase